MTDEMADDLPEQMRIRREKRDRLLEMGEHPYPVRLPITHSISAVRSAHAGLEPDVATGDLVGIAGRVIFLRNTGKLCFATLRAGDGTEIQAMVSLASVGEESLEDFKRLVDLGDHLFVHGEVITSRRGEHSGMTAE
ncbi:MAG: OB-fold nucleic acid binding domain-containing protein, partial [Candidatus Nanopelagicales bacterium]